MPAQGRVHDRAVLDALEASGSQPFEGNIWRVTRKELHALRGSSAYGCWSPTGEFEVLYTSLERDGALAEIGHRLSLEPVWPSRIQHDIHTIEVHIERTLHLADLDSLKPLGVDVNRYASYDYSVTQAIAAAAHFLSYDGLVVPNARFPGLNLVLFLDRLYPEGRLEIRATEPVDWTAWRKTRAALRRGSR